jgi:hypothetical protein
VSDEKQGAPGLGSWLASAAGKGLRADPSRHRQDRPAMVLLSVASDRLHHYATRAHARPNGIISRPGQRIQVLTSKFPGFENELRGQTRESCEGKDGITGSLLLRQDDGG